MPTGATSLHDVHTLNPLNQQVHTLETCMYNYTLAFITTTDRVIHDAQHEASVH